jgi:PIN domain nuclease of toxin-antitoxin system
MAIRFSLGKLLLSMHYRDWMDRVIAELVLAFLPIHFDHTERMANLPWHHRDQFDRMLAAQALVEPIKLVSSDVIFDRYGVDRIWQ